MDAQLHIVRRAEEDALAPARWRLASPRGLARHLAMVALGMLLLLAAIAANGRPTVFSDTDDYYSEGNSIARDANDALYHHKPILSREMIRDHWMQDDNGDEEPIHNEEGARSPYYGMFLWVLHHVGTIWLIAAAQAALVAGAIYALWRLIAPRAPVWSYPAAMASLAIGSPLPYVAGFAVPDALTGVAAICGIVFLLYADRLPLAARIATWLALAFAFNAHMSHILTGLVVTICAIPVLLAFKIPARTLWLRAAAISCAALVAVAANAAYAFTVQLRTGDELRGPPFLSIRVIADGPGRDYLKDVCPKHPDKWALCAFANKPLLDSNTLMWSDDLAVGIFNISEYPVRLRMEHEEIPFVLSAIAYRPLEQLGASLSNWWLQLMSISLNEVLIDPYFYLHDSYWKHTHLPTLVLGPGSCGQGEHECASRFTEAVLRWQEWAVIALTFWFLAYRLSRADVRHALARRNFSDAKTQAVIVIGMLLAVVIVNAGVCGVISGVFGRYQARIVWFVPLAAAIAVATWGWRPRRLHVVSS